MIKISLRSCRDFAHECFSFGSEALSPKGEAVRGFVKSQVEFPHAQIRVFLFSFVFVCFCLFLFFFYYVFSSARKFVLAESTETSIKC